MDIPLLYVTRFLNIMMSSPVEYIICLPPGLTSVTMRFLIWPSHRPTSMYGYHSAVYRSFSNQILLLLMRMPLFNEIVICVLGVHILFNVQDDRNLINPSVYFGSYYIPVANIISNLFQNVFHYDIVDLKIKYFD